MEFEDSIKALTTRAELAVTAEDALKFAQAAEYVASAARTLFFCTPDKE